MIGIYKITSPTGRIYIGQSVNIERRFNDYKRYNCKAQTKLYRSLVKHGHESHKFETVMQCQKSELNKYETFFISLYLSHLSPNLNCMMDGVLRGSFSEETRQKMSIARRGKKLGPRTDEQRKYLSEIRKGKRTGTDNHFFGKKHSEETLKKWLGKHNHFGASNPKAKLVLNLETGIFYDTASEASIHTKYKAQTFICMLCGQKKNKTSFIYA